MTLRASVSAAELDRAVNGAGRWVFRVETKRRTDAVWTDLSKVAGGDWVLGVSSEGDSPDRPASGFTIRFLRAADGASLAAGISASVLNRDAQDAFSPLVYPGRMVRVFVANLAEGQTRDVATWHLWLVGEIDRADWSGDPTATCSTLDSRIIRRQIKEIEKRGAADPGVPLAGEIQALLDKYMGHGAVPLLVVGDPDQGVGEYETARGSLGQFTLTQAQRIAWDLRYRWDDASDDFRYTLYLPPRDKTTADLSLSPSQIYEVPGLSVDRENVRNDVTVEFTSAESGKRETVTGRNEASVAEFDEAAMFIGEPGDSPVKSTEAAQALLSYALNDLAQPPVEKRVRIPFLPWLTLHHTIETGADGIHFDYPQLYSVVNASHEVDAEQGASTIVSLRGGSPVGQYYAWRRRGGYEPAPSSYELNDWRAVEAAPGFAAWTWTPGAGVASVWWATALVDADVVGDPWPEMRAAVLPLTPAGTNTVTVPLPPEGKLRLVRVEARYLDGSGALLVGGFREPTVYGTAAPVSWKFIPDETTSILTLAAVVTDPRGVVEDAQFYRRELGIVTGPFPANGAVGGVWSYSIPRDPKHPVALRVELLRNDDVAPIASEWYSSDIDRSADLTLSGAAAGGLYLISAQGDTDLAVGANNVRWRVGGGEWTEITVDVQLRAAWTVTPDAGDVLQVEAQGRNAAGEWGPIVTHPVPPTTPGATDDPAPLLGAAEWNPEGAGDCAGGAALTNRVTWGEVLNSSSSGYSLRIDSRASNGPKATGAYTTGGASYPLTTTYADLGDGGRVAGSPGTVRSYSYRVVVVRERDGAIVSAAETASGTRTVVTCP